MLYTAPSAVDESDARKDFYAYTAPFVVDKSDARKDFYAICKL